MSDDPILGYDLRRIREAFDDVLPHTLEANTTVVVPRDVLGRPEMLRNIAKVAVRNLYFEALKERVTPAGAPRVVAIGTGRLNSPNYEVKLALPVSVKPGLVSPDALEKLHEAD